MQNSYSLLDRDAERELLPLCLERGLGFTPFSPLAGGWLTGKYRRGEEPPPGSRMTLRPGPYEHLRTDAVFDQLEELERKAAAEGTTMATLAIRWLLAQPRVTAVIHRAHAGPTQLEPVARGAYKLLAVQPVTGALSQVKDREPFLRHLNGYKLGRDTHAQAHARSRSRRRRSPCTRPRGGRLWWRR